MNNNNSVDDQHLLPEGDDGLLEEHEDGLLPEVAEIDLPAVISGGGELIDFSAEPTDSELKKIERSVV